MKSTHNTLTHLLGAWDRLEVVGTNPDNTSPYSQALSCIAATTSERGKSR